mgnify:CR=1 FL=1
MLASEDVAAHAPPRLAAHIGAACHAPFQTRWLARPALDRLRGRAKPTRYPHNAAAQSFTRTRPGTHAARSISRRRSSSRWRRW